MEALGAAHGIASSAAAFAAAQPPTPGYGGVVLLDVEPQTPVERSFLERMTTGARFLLVTASAAVDDLEDLARRLGAEVERAPSTPSSTLEAMRRRLFARASSTDAEPSEPKDDHTLTLRSCRSEAQEAVEIARAVLARAESGVPFDRMAVVLRAPTLHQPLIEDAFRRAGVEAFFTRGTRRPSPGGRALLALLSCAEENLSAARFAEYLGFSQVPGDPLERAEPPPWVPAAPDAAAPQLAFAFEAPAPSAPDDAAIEGALQIPSRWEQWLVDAAVVGTEARWRRRLDGLLAELDAQRAREPDPAARDGIAHRARSVAALRDFALPIIDRLAQLRAARPWSAWLDALDQLATAALREPRPVRQVLAELRPLADVRSVSLFEVRLALLEPLSTLRPEPSREPYGAVWVGTPDELAGRSFDSVFVPGLSEGVFPPRLREDPLLGDPLRAALDPALPERRRHRLRERRAFRAALEAAESRVLLTSSRLRGARARAQVPSQYLLEVARHTGAGLDAVRALTHPAPDRTAFGLGWEVPQTPEPSIDATEYDLAVVAELDRLEPEARRGRAAYLTRDAIAHRALRRRGERWRSRFGAHDGAVIQARADEWRAAFADGLGAIVTSPTALQNFAQCPYRFFLHGISRLRDDDEPLGPERLDPRTRGSIFHEIQFRYVRRCAEDGVSPSASLDRLDAIWSETVERYREEIAPAIPAVYDRACAQIRTDLRGWWRRRAESPDGFSPTHAELAFGLGPGDPNARDPASAPEPVRLDGRFPVRGSIDLVERNADGAVRVTDYKTGRPPTDPPEWIGGGETLQPMIYAVAGEALLGHPVYEGRLAYCTVKHAYRVDAVSTVDRAALSQVVATIDDHVRRGFLPAAPREGACRFCEYRVRCGHGEETRLERKDHEALASLAALRSIR
jgi:RecB family exonuclease